MLPRSETPPAEEFCCGTVRIDAASAGIKPHTTFRWNEGPYNDQIFRFICLIYKPIRIRIQYTSPRLAGKGLSLSWDGF